MRCLPVGLNVLGVFALAVLLVACSVLGAFKLAVLQLTCSVWLGSVPWLLTVLLLAPAACAA